MLCSTNCDKKGGTYDIISTIQNKSNVPNYIKDNRKTYANEYTNIIFDDNDCLDFLKKNYSDMHVDKFKEIPKGAHKADLFRYAYLYMKGGLYVDIKTLFIKNINTVIKDTNLSYFIMTGDRLYNGIIYTPPRNLLMLKMLEFSMKITNNDEYFYNLIHGTQLIKQNLELKNTKIIPGLNITNNNIPNIYVYSERYFDKRACDNTTDRYGICSFVVDNTNTKLIKIRDAKYTPNYK
jgi:hypothetical protein